MKDSNRRVRLRLAEPAKAEVSQPSEPEDGTTEVRPTETVSELKKITALFSEAV